MAMRRRYRFPVTTVIEAPAANTSPRPRRRRIIVRVVAALVSLAVLAGAAFGISWLIYIHRYQPLGLGNTGGLVRSVSVVDDGLGDEAYLVRGPAGTRATMMYSLRNDGPFDVTILGPESYPLGQMSFTWESINSEAAGLPAMFAASHAMPARLRSHQQIRLFVTVTKPRCTPGGSNVISGLPVRWKALGIHHVTQVDLTGGVGGRIALCFGAKALRLLPDHR
jgi:hypothetical protein